MFNTREADTVLKTHKWLLKSMGISGTSPLPFTLRRFKTTLFARSRSWRNAKGLCLTSTTEDFLMADTRGSKMFFFSPKPTFVAMSAKFGSCTGANTAAGDKVFLPAMQKLLGSARELTASVSLEICAEAESFIVKEILSPIADGKESKGAVLNFDAGTGVQGKIMQSMGPKAGVPAFITFALWGEKK